MGRLDGKVAVITGTGSGMGRAAALLFAREGAQVVGCDIDAARAEAVLAEVQAAGGAMVSIQPLDLSKPADAERLIAFAVESYGGIDVLYNNAAMAYFAPVAEMDYATFNRTMTEEVDIVFHVTRAAWPHLVARGGGSIVNTASAAGKGASPNLGALAHCTAKGAVIAMTRQYAGEGAAHNIRANTISPGLIRSAQTEVNLGRPEWVEAVMKSRMIKRAGEAEEVAQAALFLASDESSYVTGADLAVDGGSTAM